MRMIYCAMMDNIPWNKIAPIRPRGCVETRPQLYTMFIDVKRSDPRRSGTIKAVFPSRERALKYAWHLYNNGTWGDSMVSPKNLIDKS